MRVQECRVGEGEHQRGSRTYVHPRFGRFQELSFVFAQAFHYTRVLLVPALCVILFLGEI